MQTLSNDGDWIMHCEDFDYLGPPISAHAGDLMCVKGSLDPRTLRSTSTFAVQPLKRWREGPETQVRPMKVTSKYFHC